MERTLIILKPDAVKKGVVNDVLNIIKAEGFKIEHIRTVALLDKATLEEHYAAHKDRPFFKELIDFMISGDAIPAVITGEDAVKRIRTLIGSTIPADAGPNTIRGQFSDDTMEAANAEGRCVHNIIHASGNTAEAETEMKTWFPEIFNREPAPQGARVSPQKATSIRFDI